MDIVKLFASAHMLYSGFVRLLLQLLVVITNTNDTRILYEEETKNCKFEIPTISTSAPPSRKKYSKKHKAKEMGLHGETSFTI